MENLYIVLVRPKFSENIGFCARACANFGAKNLVVVNPENFDYQIAKKTATNIGKNILENIEIISDIGEITNKVNFVIGTTARLGEQRKVNYSLVEFVPDIVGLLEENKVAILFGNERTGLTNEELLSCDETITIPTYNNTSLNLSHALAIVLYEIHKNIEKPRLEKEIKLASPKEKELIFNMLIEVIKEVNYIPHNNETLWMRNIKEFINNLNLTSRNSKIFLGLLRSTIKKLRRN